MITYRTKDGDMIDEICWKHYGRQSGAVEALLEANRGLADAGPMLPAGLVLALPDLSADKVEPTVRLWD
jgi:phage tail protein X